MEKINVFAGWIGISLGFLAGAVLGIFFQKEDWLGGYSSWKRRLLRLGHISFFGLAFINFAFAWTVSIFQLHSVGVPSFLFVVAAVMMPLSCFWAAYKKSLQFILFPIPITALLIAAAYTMRHILL